MPSRWSARRERFRGIIEGHRCVHPASVFDAISARIAEDLGFEVGMFAGSVASLAVLGAPDNISITLSEFAGQAHRICRAGDLALMVDADHGYGNALSVMRTVEELETSGISGLTIEDTLLPEPFGGGPARLIPVEEGAGKLKAAVAARHDPALVIAGRTGAVSIAGLDEAMARVKVYSATGVDAIFLSGVKTMAEIEGIRSVTSLPILLGGGALMEADALAAKGVRICLQGHQPFQAAVEAVRATLEALRNGIDPDKLPGLASAETMKQVTKAADYQRWRADFLGAGGK